MFPYGNITLRSADNNVEVTVFLPAGTVDNFVGNAYYYGSRFEHGSMIGNIRIRKNPTSAEEDVSVKNNNNDDDDDSWHTYFGTDMWRMPHNAHWPESGVGLASEFGVGDDGDFCFYRCGWPEASGVTNGVLGYREARSGEAFLKLGVGALIKGSCPTCDSTDDYKFNSPYLFASQPQWKLEKRETPSSSPYNNNNNLRTGSDADTNIRTYAVHLEHEQVLRQQHGYKIQKDISLVEEVSSESITASSQEIQRQRNNVLLVTTTLTNLGSEPFKTVWYSHNLFSCDRRAVGPGYAVDLDLSDWTGNNNLQASYQEPGTWSWSTPLERFAKVVSSDLWSKLNQESSNNVNSNVLTTQNKNNNIRIQLEKSLDPGIRIKSEFVKPPPTYGDNATQGGFVLEACQQRIKTTLHLNNEGQQQEQKLKMYADNLYMERGTFSPEPQILLEFAPGQTISWTQRLEFFSLHDEENKSNNNNNLVPSSSTTNGFLGFTQMLSGWISPTNKEQSKYTSSTSATALSASDSMPLIVMIACSSFIVIYVIITKTRRMVSRRSQYTSI